MPAARLPLLVPVLVLAAVAAGCGGGGGGSDQDQITKVTRQFISDAKSGRWDDACDSMSSAAKRQIAKAGVLLGQTDCPKVLAAAFALDDDNTLDKIDPDEVQLKDLKIDGSHASAETVPATSDNPVNQYIKEDGRWKLDADPEDGSNSSTTSESTTNPGPVPQKAPTLSAGERGFAPIYTGVAYGAIIHNPGPNDAVDVAVKVDAVDADGQVLGTETNDLTGVPAGADFGVAGRIDPGEQHVNKLEITITVDHGEKAGSIVLPKVSNVQLRQADLGTEVSAQMTNTLDKELNSFTDLFAVLRDGSGRIVGGLSAYPGDSYVAVGKRTSVVIGGTGGDDIAAKSADVYVNPETS